MLRNEEQLSRSMERAYLPKHLSSFEQTLRLAKERRTQQRKMLATASVGSLILVGCVALAISWSPAKSEVPQISLSSVPVATQTPTPEPKEEEAITPPTNTQQPAGEPTKAKKPPKQEEEKGYLVVNSFPLIGLTVVVDEKRSAYQTPVTSPGLELSAGAHTLFFEASTGEKYGPYKVTISANETTRERFSVQKKEVGEQAIDFDGKISTKAKNQDPLFGGSKKEKNPQADPESLANPFTTNKDPLMGFDGRRSDDGSLLIETKPKIKGLSVYIDGKSTSYKTPVRGDGIRLAAGSYSVELKDVSGVSYGTFTIVINKGSSQKQTLSVAPSEKSKDNTLPKSLEF